MGEKADYFIAMSVKFEGNYEFPVKQFYWCTSLQYQFKKFPELNDQHKADYDRLSSFFKGDPNLVIKKVEKDEDEKEADDQEENKENKEVDPFASSEEEDPASLIVPVNLKEIDRLHYTVRAIESDCNIVPVGSFKLTTEHEVRRNEAFKGLDKFRAFDLNSYMHFRNVLT